jgi:hypothetical protein
MQGIYSDLSGAISRANAAVEVEPGALMQNKVGDFLEGCDYQPFEFNAFPPVAESDLENTG